MSKKQFPIINRENYLNWLQRIKELDNCKKLFIVGAQKSGTTWIQKLLNTHPEISIDGECHFQLIMGLFKNVIDNFNQQQVSRFSRSFNPENIIYNETDFLNISKVLMDNQMLKRYEPGIKWIGDKTPEYCLILDSIKFLYPDVKIIHIIRDGRDCVTSLRFYKNRPKYNTFNGLISYYVPNHWIKYIQLARKFGNANPDNYLEVRYEDLHNDSYSTLKNIFISLYLKDSDSIIQKCINKADFKVLSDGREKGDADNTSFYRKGIIGDWKNNMDKETHDFFQTLAGNLMSELGYSTIYKV